MHDGGHVCVRVVLAQEVSRQADSLMARLTAQSATCRQRQAMSPKSADNVVCRRHVADMSATFPTELPTTPQLGKRADGVGDKLAISMRIFSNSDLFGHCTNSMEW